MKKIVSKILIAFVVLSFLSFNYPDEPETYSLSVKIVGFRNSEGHVQCALYNKDGSLPDEDFEKYYKMQIGEINNEVSIVSFEGLPKGTYAINILHDENKNGKVDKGFILPIEGLGFSNYTALGLANRPSFGRASFEINSDKEITVQVIYM
ncbi:MAG: DUF2141 domain-containing protein [Bacteroidales bacterium]|nr:DUF2141 domain-containing protein [Bacteroidales bacterium]